MLSKHNCKRLPVQAWIALLVIFAIPRIGLAQLEVNAVPVIAIVGAEEVKTLGNVILIPQGSELKPQSALMVYIETEAGNVDVKFEDQARNRVEFEKLDDKTYAITTPGKIWIDVTAIDFGKNIYKTERVVAELKAGGGGLNAGIEVQEPVSELRPIAERLADKLQTDEDKAQVVASVMYGFSIGMAGASGKRITSVGTFGKVVNDSLRDLKTAGGPSIQDEWKDMLRSYVGFTEEPDGMLTDKKLTDMDRQKLVQVFEALAWAGVQ